MAENSQFLFSVKAFLKSLSLLSSDSAVFADVLYNLGHFFQSLAEFKFARLCYLSALSSDPEHLEARNNLAICQIHLGFFDLGVKGFEMVQEELYEGAFNHATAKIKRGSFQEISEVVKKVVEKAKTLGHVEGEIIQEWFDQIVSG